MQMGPPQPPQAASCASMQMGPPQQTGCASMQMGPPQPAGCASMQMGPPQPAGCASTQMGPPQPTGCAYTQMGPPQPAGCASTQMGPPQPAGCGSMQMGPPQPAGCASTQMGPPQPPQAASCASMQMGSPQPAGCASTQMGPPQPPQAASCASMQMGPPQPAGCASTQMGPPQPPQAASCASMQMGPPQPAGCASMQMGPPQPPQAASCASMQMGPPQPTGRASTQMGPQPTGGAYTQMGPPQPASHAWANYTGVVGFDSDTDVQPDLDPANLPCESTWFQKLGPLSCPTSLGGDWKTYRHLQSRKEFKALMAPRAILIDDFLYEKARISATCNICAAARGYKEHLGGPAHYSKLSKDYVKCGIPVESVRGGLYNKWQIPGGWVRINEMDGAIDLAKGLAEPSDARTHVLQNPPPAEPSPVTPEPSPVPQSPPPEPRPSFNATGSTIPSRPGWGSVPEDREMDECSEFSFCGHGVTTTGVPQADDERDERPQGMPRSFQPGDFSGSQPGPSRPRRTARWGSVPEGREMDEYSEFSFSGGTGGLFEDSDERIDHKKILELCWKKLWNEKGDVSESAQAIQTKFGEFGIQTASWLENFKFSNHDTLTSDWDTFRICLLIDCCCVFFLRTVRLRNIHRGLCVDVGGIWGSMQDLPRKCENSCHGWAPCKQQTFCASHASNRSRPHVRHFFGHQFLGSTTWRVVLHIHSLSKAHKFGVWLLGDMLGCPPSQ